MEKHTEMVEAGAEFFTEDGKMYEIMRYGGKCYDVIDTQTGEVVEQGVIVYTEGADGDLTPCPYCEAQALLAELEQPTGVVVHCCVCGAQHTLIAGEILGISNPHNELWICPECVE